MSQVLTGSVCVEACAYPGLTSTQIPTLLTPDPFSNIEIAGDFSFSIVLLFLFGITGGGASWSSTDADETFFLLTGAGGVDSTESAKVPVD